MHDPGVWDVGLGAIPTKLALHPAAHLRMWLECPYVALFANVLRQCLLILGSINGIWLSFLRCFWVV